MKERLSEILNLKLDMEQIHDWIYDLLTRMGLIRATSGYWDNIMILLLIICSSFPAIWKSLLALGMKKLVNIRKDVIFGVYAKALRI